MKTIIISVLLIFLSSLHVLNNQALAQLTNWQYITPITVYENSGGNLTDYRVLLTFDTQTPISQGKMKTDGSDMRFAEDVDGAFLLNYWIESGINTNSTNVWIKAPFIPALDSVIIYLFYGNPSATTTSSVSSVFYSGLQALYTFTEGIGDTLYDKLGNYNLPLTGLTWQAGFRNNVFSLTGWTGGGRSFIGSNGPVLGTGDFTAFAFINPANTGGSTQGVVGNYFTDSDNGWVVKLQGGAGNFMLLTNELGNWCQQSAGTLTTAWAHVGAKRNSGVSDYMYQNGNNILTLCPNDNRNLNNTGPFEIGRSYNNQYPFDGDISFVAVYNTALLDTEIDSLYKGLYVSPEPTLSIGTEGFISPLEVTNDTSICISSSVNLTVTITDSAEFPAPYTFLWSPADSLSCTTCQSPIANPTSTTTYMVIVIDSAGVQDSAFVTVTIFVSTPIADAGTDTSFCLGNSVQLNATGGVYYSWAPGAGLSDSTIANPLSSPVTTTTYEVTVSNGCGSDVDSVTITVIVPPVDAGVDTFYCFGVGGSVILEALGAISFVWSPAAGLSCTSCPKPTASPSSTTTYYVIGTDANGCTNTDSITITVSGVPIVAVSSIETICPGDSAQFDVFTSISCDDYIVSTIPFAPIAGSGTFITLGDDQVSPSLPLGFTFNFYCNDYTQFYISSNGFIGFSAGTPSGCCSGQLLPNPVDPNNIIAFAWDDLYPPGNGTIDYFTTGTAPNRKLVMNFTDIPFCCGSTPVVSTQTILYETTNIIEIHTTFINNINPGTMGIENDIGTVAHVVPGRNSSSWSAINEGIRFSSILSIPDTMLTYSWSPSTGLSDPSIADPFASPATTTTYFVTAEDNGCITTDTITLYVNNTIIALTADVGICTGDSIQLSATSNNPIVAWSWSPPNNLSDTTIANPIANPSSTTTYTVTATDAMGCQFTLDVTISVAPYPTASFTHFDSVLTVAFTDSSVNASSLLWNFGNGFTSGLQNPTYTYATPGTYNACLIVTNACTSDTSCEWITVTDCQFPLALFGYSVSGLTVDFSDLSINATGWSWDFGDSSAIDNNQNPIHTYADTGTYYVCLTTTNSCGSNSICNVVTVSAITPGFEENWLENGINIYPNPNSGEFDIDISLPKQENVVITIYNLLGEIVHEFEEVNVQQASYSVNLHHLNNGAYIIKVEAKHQFIVRELILSK